MTNAQQTKTTATCDICQHRILAGEKFSDDGSEIAHTACVKDWFRRNFGREGLA
jgi:hypothetical protein